MGCMGIINRLYVQYVSLLAHCLYEMLDVKTNTFENGHVYIFTAVLLGS